MQQRFLKFLKRSLLLFTFVGLLSVQLQAQDVITPGGGVDPGVINDNTGITGGSGNADIGDGPVDLEGASSLDLGGQEEDTRNQGFVGATAPGVTANTFVGAASPNFGELAPDATFGGGVNDGGTNSIPGGGGAGGGGNLGGGAGAGAQGGAGGFGGATSGGVFRSNLRARLRPSFDAPVISPQFTENSFNNNLARQPSAQSLVGRYQIFVQNKTVTVTGVVNSQADADRLIRQLRLQPGIYGKIDNQLQIIK